VKESDGGGGASRRGEVLITVLNSLSCNVTIKSRAEAETPSQAFVTAAGGSVLTSASSSQRFGTSCINH